MREVIPPDTKKSAKKRLIDDDDDIDVQKKKAHEADNMLGVSPLPGVGESQSLSIVQMQDFLLNSFQVILVYLTNNIYSI